MISRIAGYHTIDLLRSRTKQSLIQILKRSKRRTTTKTSAGWNTSHRAATLSTTANPDNLLGHSPMASPTPMSSSVRLPKVDPGVAIRTGVWQLTSPKKEKLVELRGELKDGQESLDELLTREDEKMDVWFALGIKAIAQQIDEGWDTATTNTTDTDTTDTTSQGVALTPDDSWWFKPLSDFLASTESGSHDNVFTQDRYESHLNEAKRHLEQALLTLDSTALGYVRDIVPFELPKGVEEGDVTEADFQDSTIQKATAQCATFVRIQLTMALVDVLLKSWKELTTPTNADVDRAAVRREESLPKQLHVDKINILLRAYASENSEKRIKALWDVVATSKDGDDLLDEEEMHRVVQYFLKTWEEALKTTCDQALDAQPLDETLESTTTTSVVPQKTRRQVRHKKKTMRTLQRSFKTHFEEDLECPHRLRCIYAWAYKEHQSNRVDSVLVENQGQVIGGRQRHVELPPKISFAEFLDVQKDHFPHLDRAGQEFMTGFHEDLWIRQGVGRQNRELRRDAALFFLAVGMLDVVILYL